MTVAVIAALAARGLPVASFKCGPDYIDPMFHRAALGTPSHNLDPFFSTPQQLREQVALGGRDALGVIEGVMGYYDGIGASTRASTYDVAAATRTPAVLVLDARGMAASAGAVLHGFAHYRTPSHLRGVIVAMASAGAYASIEPLIREADLQPLGFLPRHDTVTWPSRRLGLVTADELGHLRESIDTLARLAADHLDLDALIDIAASAPVLPEPMPAAGEPWLPVAAGSPIRLAVARDEAFCFVYAETLELFERLGAEIVFFSPLHDARLPDADALYLPGGYPENHADALAANAPMRAAVNDTVSHGLPTIAECGGFMYLHRSIDGRAMAGVFDAEAFATPRLQRFGYATLVAAGDTLLARAGDTLPVHEFHYYESSADGAAFTATKTSNGASYVCGHATSTLYAAFPHLYLAAVPRAAERFVEAARRHAAKQVAS